MIDVRRGTASDLNDVRGLLERSRLPLDGLTDDAVVVVACDQSGRIVGSAALEEFANGALLRSVAVDAAIRGQRLGIRLTQAALDLAALRGHGDIYLLTTTAAGFFPRFGFALIERSAVPADVRSSVEFVSACPSSAVVMHARSGGRFRSV